jgi:D-glycero-alpha-D-manno-heptose-7-phosphate kinase
MAHYCYLSVRYLPQFFNHRYRIVYSKLEEVMNRDQIQHPSVRGCLEYLDIKDGVEIHHVGSLPARSGIGSSSSFTVGLLHALHTLVGVTVGPEQLAKEAIEVEQVLLRESVGIQDQILASYGGFQRLHMGPGNNWNAQPMILPAEYLAELECNILLGYSGTSRNSEEHASATIENIENGRIDASLEEMKQIAQEACLLLENQASMNEIGRMLALNWNIKRQLTKSGVPSWMDQIYQAGMRSGAFGGKLMGAGGGGFFFFLAPPNRHDSIREALPQIDVWVPFRVELSGSQVILNS